MRRSKKAYVRNFEAAVCRAGIKLEAKSWLADIVVAVQVSDTTMFNRISEAGYKKVNNKLNKTKLKYSETDNNY
jgi:hypothetical protein